jgi:transcriptional regulator with XRE-family HTH domain
METNDTRIRIGRRIAKLRAEKNMTQADLAKASGVTLANISRIERGQYSPGLDVLTKIADALGAQIDIV